MLYESIKVAHIISSALLLTSMANSFLLWKTLQRSRDSLGVLSRIQIQTWFAIIPLSIFQLATGFTMISLQAKQFSSVWIGNIVMSFIIAIGTWISFLYFLLLSQQATMQLSKQRSHFFRRTQSVMLVICAFAMLYMIFLMANKTS